jgi:alpha,alpha-trehalose phosphorylase
MNTADAKQDTGTPDTQYLRDYGDDPWRLNIAGLDTENVNLNETLFSLSNGFLGMRGNFTESLPVGSHGTFLNGLHETWKIEHAENAYGFAETGQTIVNVPDSKTIRLYVDDERLNLLTAEIFDATQQLDMRDGVLRRSFVWRTPSGKHVTVEMRRMVSFTHRHIATTEYTVSVDRDAELTLSSLIVNRQDLGRTGTESRRASYGCGGLLWVHAAGRKPAC